MKNASPYEQETIICFNAAGDVATVSTNHKPTIRKLDKLVEIAPEAYTKILESTDAHDARYTMPKKLVRFGKPASQARREAASKAILSRIPKLIQAREAAKATNTDDD